VAKLTGMSTPENQLGPVVIVGGGLAGQRCTETLRRRGYDGPTRMICAESDPPYDRPPLSKDVLGDASRESSLPYRPAAWYEEHNVDLLLGVRAERLRPGEHRVDLSDGSSLPYAQLLIATGSAPRDLPALARGESVSVLRTLPDSRALREALADGPHLAVVGAGFIGQEVAASARRLGLEVTMIEAAPQPLMGVLGPELGAWFARLHRDEGVRVLTDSSVEGTDRNGRLRAVHLAGGERIEVDHVLVAVGVVPCVQWLAGTGLDGVTGVPVDGCARTACEHVYAAGDVAATRHPVSGRRVPGAHWESAGRQGAVAATAMLGDSPAPAPPSSFWSDQYGLRIQYVGSSEGSDAVAIDGDPAQRSFTATFTRQGRPVAALLVNRPRELPAIRTQIQRGTS
jgi:3-phenylpropionate/trans-cinnamate dioxygenase ferredoxin reductase component